MPSWTGYSEHSHLSGKLAESERHDFERKALSVLRVMWPSAELVLSNRGLDKAGIDIIVQGATEPHPLVVQCKGFTVLERELGNNQIRQCVNSIMSFKEKGITAHTYLLIHNRDGRDASFRLRVQKALQELKDTGQVSEAHLWDRQKLIKTAFDTMYERAKQVLLSGKLALEYSGFTTYQPLDLVPLKETMLLTNQFGLLGEETVKRLMASPADKLISTNHKITILSGMAGYGKTTATRLAIEKSSKPILYVPAAIISKDTTSTRDVLMHLVNLDNLIANVSAEDWEVHKAIGRAAIGRLLAVEQEGIDTILILDGIDESVYFTRQAGMQWLLNAFRDVKVPIVLTVRTEMWNELYKDFATLTGRTTGKGHSKAVRVRHIQLIEWDDSEIIELSSRFQKGLDTEIQRTRIQDFIALVRKGDYQNIYGDIPKRPLFLSWILETVADSGVHPVNRAKLFQEYATKKITRDIWDIIEKRGPGRLSLSPEGELPEDSIELSFRLMIQAAGLMTEIVDDELELLSNCYFDELVASHPDFSDVSKLGLSLTSLLMSLPRQRDERTKLTFTHRVFQEIFLAHFINLNPQQFSEIRLPDNVNEWLKDIMTP